MTMPLAGSAVTQTQIQAAPNLDSFAGAMPGNNWHIGQFEPWALQFGYANGTPMYGSVRVGGANIHIYYLNDGTDRTVILNLGKQPSDYGIV